MHKPLPLLADLVAATLASCSQMRRQAPHKIQQRQHAKEDPIRLVSRLTTECWLAQSRLSWLPFYCFLMIEVDSD